VAANIQFKFLLALLHGLLDSVLLKNDRMHTIDRARLRTFREELLAADGTSHDIAHQGVALGQISREVHFLPAKSAP